MELKEELEVLQRDLALVDLVTEPHRASRGDFIEVLLVRLKRIKIKIYQEANHTEPHLHIDYGPHHHIASYSISEGKRIAGTLDAKYDRAIRKWIMNHVKKLAEVWQTMQSGGDPSRMIAELAGDV